MRRPRVLLVGTEPPALGGAGTASALLFLRLLADAWDVRYVAVVDEAEMVYLRARNGGVAPRPHEDRFEYVHRDGVDAPRVVELADLIDRHRPDVAVACGFAAVLLVKEVAPALSTVFLAGTCRQGQDHVTSGRFASAMSLMQGVRCGAVVPRVVHQSERRAVLACDLLVAQTPETLELFEYFFPTSIGSMHRHVVSCAEWVAGRALAEQPRARPWAARDIDVLFVASRWKCPAKSYAAVRRLARELRNLRVHVVGDVECTAPGAVHHGFVADAQRVLDLMGAARTLVCPSMFDPAPCALIEGALMGANVVATPSCGNAGACHPDLLCPTSDVPALVDSIHRALDRPYPHRLGAHLSQGSYAHLTALLEAVAAPRP